VKGETVFDEVLTSV